MSLEPAIAALLGFLILGQELQATGIVAIALVSIACAGATLSSRRAGSQHGVGRRPRPRPPTRTPPHAARRPPARRSRSVRRADGCSRIGRSASANPGATSDTAAQSPTTADAPIVTPAPATTTTLAQPAPGPTTTHPPAEIRAPASRTRRGGARPKRRARPRPARPRDPGRAGHAHPARAAARPQRLKHARYLARDRTVSAPIRAHGGEPADRTHRMGVVLPVSRALQRRRPRSP